MHEVVPMAVRNAVSAATITFTANSMIFCFFIRFVFFRGRRNEEGGARLCRLLPKGRKKEITQEADTQDSAAADALPLEYLFPLLS